MTLPADTIRVVADAGNGRLVADFVLAHGSDPVRELGRQGWGGAHLTGARREATGELVLAFAVVPASVPGPSGPPGSAAGAPVPTDAGLVVGPDEVAHPYQRTAAYGVVTSARGLLLTELSALTSAPGRWTLPGGGLDPHEQPVEALHREVWEESGQVVTDVRLLEVHTSHWVGRAPSGRLEDFHAVRIVYAAWCPDATDPVVHDVGGSTESVQWVPLDRVAQFHLGRSFAPHLQRWLES